uniref:Uncharacterized protein LOC113788814 n=1 Tax=Dermatophagoides pteronyssinus TaxID=6956 RepID=A0A6P6XKZ8_DERPT|nr:uncharacterized protein LOC113788814 [Dermatophagoides pteronyssinus]
MVIESKNSSTTSRPKHPIIINFFKLSTNVTNKQQTTAIIHCFSIRLSINFSSIKFIRKSNLNFGKSKNQKTHRQRLYKILPYFSPYNNNSNNNTLLPHRIT